MDKNIVLNKKTILSAYDLGIMGIEPLNENFTSLIESQAQNYSRRTLSKVFSFCEIENRKDCKEQISAQILATAKSKSGNQLALHISNLINNLFSL